ncbi:MAG: hypothetical protein U1F43_16340 [Myxococcota bacterium]
MQLELFDLVHGAARATVAPARGGIVTGLAVDGRSILHMDAATLADPTKNVRGGIPVLFPFAGRLPGDVFARAGTRMKQHGFGRNLAWRVTAREADALSMALGDDDTTRAVFPWSFRADASVRAVARGVRIELATTNLGTTPMPLSPGWHPYFVCPPAAKDAVASDLPGLAAGALDDLREHDFGLPAPADGMVDVALPDLGALRLSFAPSMRHVQVWTLPGSAFVCIEPFWGPAGTIDGDACQWVEPGATAAVWMRIELLAAG